MVPGWASRVGIHMSANGEEGARGAGQLVQQLGDSARDALIGIIIAGN